jgi:hypothetical protein
MNFENHSLWADYSLDKRKGKDFGEDYSQIQKEESVIKDLNNVSSVEDNSIAIFESKKIDEEMPKLNSEVLSNTVSIQDSEYDSNCSEFVMKVKGQYTNEIDFIESISVPILPFHTSITSSSLPPLKNCSHFLEVCPECSHSTELTKHRTEQTNSSSEGHIVETLMKSVSCTNLFGSSSKSSFNAPKIDSFQVNSLFSDKNLKISENPLYDDMVESYKERLKEEELERSGLPEEVFYEDVKNCPDLKLPRRRHSLHDRHLISLKVIKDVDEVSVKNIMDESTSNVSITKKEDSSDIWDNLSKGKGDQLKKKYIDIQKRINLRNNRVSSVQRKKKDKSETMSPENSRNFLITDRKLPRSNNKFISKFL